MKLLRGLCVLFFLFPNWGMGQYGKQKKADALFATYAFTKAIPLYQELIQSDYNRDYAERKLGDCYYYLRDFEKASRLYEKVVKQLAAPSEYQLRYAIVLRDLGRREEAQTWLRSYREKGGAVKVSRNFETASEIQISDLMGITYEVTPVPFNTPGSDFAAYEHEGALYITSSGPENRNERKRYGWNDQPFLDIWLVRSKDTTSFSNLSEEVNSPYHDGPLTISKDGKTMYFSRNNYLDGKKGTDNDKTNHLKIFRSTKFADDWGNVTEVPFNGASFSTSHPALSPDNNWLYFASDRPGGEGGSDLYKVRVGSFEFGEPENLGPEINTAGNEFFPFINSEGFLFFASDGHPGLGMLDIFVASPSSEQMAFKNVRNMGAPVNSEADDFSLFMSPDGSYGYFASNRDKGPTNDEIYLFETVLPLMLKGTVTDSLNGKPIALARIALRDQNGKEIAYMETDSVGYYEVNIDRDLDYQITASKKKYKDDKKKFTSKYLPKKTTEIIVNLKLSPVRDIRILADLNTIYFDFDRYEIRPDAARELDKIVTLLTDEYPNMIMSLEAHTDSRGSFSYNDRLSIDRANATYEYLISKGLPASRIINKNGYGERRLTNGCEDGVRCEEAEHQKNRRTEFLVVE